MGEDVNRFTYRLDRNPSRDQRQMARCLRPYRHPSHVLIFWHRRELFRSWEDTLGAGVFERIHEDTQGLRKVEALRGMRSYPASYYS